MFAAISFLFVSLTAFIILTDKISVRIIKSEITIVKINLTIFAFHLILDRKNKNEKVKNKKKKKKLKTKIHLPYLIEAIIKKSTITLGEFVALFPKRSPAIDAIRYGAYTSFISSTITYFYNNAKNFSAGNIIIEYSEHNSFDVCFEAEVEISAFDFLICIIAYSANEFKRILEKRRIFYGRKQNE